MLGVPAPSDYDPANRYALWEYLQTLPGQDTLTYASHWDELNTYWDAKAVKRLWLGVWP